MKNLATIIFSVFFLNLSSQVTFDYLVRESPKGTFNVELVSTSNQNMNVIINSNQTFLFVRVPIGFSITPSGNWDVTQVIDDNQIQNGCGQSYGFDLIELSPTNNINVGNLPTSNSVILTSFPVPELNGDAFAFEGNEDCLSGFYENGLQVDLDGGDEDFRTQTLSGSTLLPIKLSSFTTHKIEERSVELLWTSELEINSSHFIVQRSDEGKHFDDIGRVEAAGNSTQTIHYNYLDRNINIQRNTSKLIYYRLKQVDIDGFTEFSEIRALRFDRIGLAEVSIYPNPTADILHLDISEDILDDQINYEIFDVQGKMVVNQQINIDHQKLHLLNLRASGLQSGIYFIKLRNQKELLSSHKFVLISQ